MTVTPKSPTRMNLPRVVRSILTVFFLGALSLGCNKKAGQELPNFIVILADDLGWRDVGYNGSAYATPHIDALAAGGMQFTSAYAASPACSPTRASLLTGFEPARLKLTRAIRISDLDGTAKPKDNAQWIGPDSLSHLPFDEESLASKLKEAGYDTGFVGKWHLGLPPHVPKRYGFAEAKAVGLYSACPHFAPYNKFLDAQDAPVGEPLTKRLTDEALRFIRQKRERPFFLMLSHFAVHGPWQADPALEARWRRELDPEAPQGNATYAAMIEGLDTSIGRLMNALKDLGLRDDTLVLFLSDNGPTLEKNDQRLTTTAPLKGAKTELYEGGIRIPFVASWPGHIEGGQKIDDPISTIDVYPTLLSLAGVKHRTVDGIDLSEGFLQQEWAEERDLYFHFPHRSFTSAIRRGPYKLIHHHRGSDELFDLTADIGESNNLIESEPERAENLRAALLAQLHSYDAGFGRPRNE